MRPGMVARTGNPNTGVETTGTLEPFSQAARQPLKFRPLLPLSPLKSLPSPCSAPGSLPTQGVTPKAVP